MEAAAAGEGTLDTSGDRWAPTSSEEVTKEEWPSETLEARKTDSKVLSPSPNAVLNSR